MKNDSVLTEKEPHIKRNRLIRLSILSSICSKVVTALCQLIVIPIAIVTIGIENYGVYATAMSLISVLCIAEQGIGLTLVRSYASTGDVGKRRRALGLSLILVLTWSAVTCTAIFLIARNRSLLEFLDINTQLKQESLEIALLVSGGLSVIGSLCGQFNRAQVGTQASHLVNWVHSIANLAAAASLYYNASCGNLTLFDFALLSQGFTTTASFGLAVFAILKSEIFRPKLALVSAESRLYIRESLAQSLLSGGAPYARIQIGRLTVSVLVGTEGTALVSALMQLGAAIQGASTMLTQPAVPGIADAVRLKDIGWATAFIRWAHVRFVVASVGVICLGAIVGADSMKLIFSKGMQYTTGEILVWLLAYALVAWGDINAAFLSAIGSSAAAAKITLIESMLSLIVGGLFAAYLGFIGLFCGWIVCALLFSMIAMPRLIGLRLSALARCK
jgi:O-antigen/teichoic acid export membrane protein